MQDLYANIIVDISHEKLDRTFQYKIPEALHGTIVPGTAVEIPFGKGNRQIKGYVMEVTQIPEFAVDKIKEILSPCGKQVGAEDNLIALAAWMRDYYGCTMIQALKTVLPVKQKTKPKERKSVHLLLTEEEAAEKLLFYQKKHQVARARLLEALIEQRQTTGTEVLPWELLNEKLNISSATLKALKEQQVVTLSSEVIYANPVNFEQKKTEQFALNTEQERIVTGIYKEWQNGDLSTCLIHGVTGSGKTEVYMELIARVISEGKQAIMLIPEIALTYQTVMRFYRRFGERISILHSKLSAGERFDQYERARKGLIDIMIGPRSALFTPFSNLGLIIIDEEHETSYKSETVPRYHARETAVRRAEMEGAKVILGSATPSMEAYYRAKSGLYHLYALEKRVEERPLPKVEIADLRQELREGNHSIISRRLAERMEERLQKGQQIMLFLNRRGYAGFLSCRSCGHVIQCPHCDVSLSLHGRNRMICHYCGHEETRPAKCPECGSPFIGEFKAGTEQVVEQVQNMFPKARTLRMDFDTTRQKDGYEKILSAFAEHEADILVGTQMIVKGHDFPDVTLVGVLAADLSLHISDYHAAERTFQLLVQAAGRAGRGRETGEVIIQTYDPDNYSIQAAVKQDYTGFYEQEILYRKLAGYPPAASLFALHGACGDEAYLTMAMDYIRKYADTLAEHYQAQIIGPAEESVARVNDIYRKVLYVRTETENSLTAIRKKVEQYLEINKGFERIGIQIEVH